MPRIRVQTPDEVRMIGLPNCSSLVIRLEAHNQRDTLQLSAEAKLEGGHAVIDHVRWDFNELPVGSTIEMISMTNAGLTDRFDPPDAAVPLPSVEGESELALALAQLEDQQAAHHRKVALAELQQAAEQLGELSPSDPYDEVTKCCSFCGRSRLEVNRMVASMTASMCDACIRDASELIKDA